MLLSFPWRWRTRNRNQNHQRIKIVFKLRVSNRVETGQPSTPNDSEVLLRMVNNTSPSAAMSSSSCTVPFVLGYSSAHVCGQTSFCSIIFYRRAIRKRTIVTNWIGSYFFGPIRLRSEGFIILLFYKLLPRRRSIGCITRGSSSTSAPILFRFRSQIRFQLDILLCSEK